MAQTDRRPAVTVALPVYNGEATIAECIDSLAAETCDSFVVHIWDNASTDQTGEICRARAASDTRFVYHRRPENIGSERNFIAALEAANTDYFCWRADDDLSDPEFLARMKALLDTNPGAALAACRIESRRPSKGRVRQFPWVRECPGPRIVNILRRMFLSHPSWIYCLWRTERLRHYYSACWEAFPTGWGNDHLVLLNAILDGAVVGDDGVRFIQRIDVRRGPGAAPLARAPYAERIAIKTDLLPRFRRVCREAVAQRDWTRRERWALARVIDFYVQKRINTSEFQIWRLKVRKAVQDTFAKAR